MAYSELIKNFDRIRDYMRQFYVYGFKSRAEYDKKSARSYDNEHRFGDPHCFHQPRRIQDALRDGTLPVPEDEKAAVLDKFAKAAVSRGAPNDEVMVWPELAAQWLHQLLG